MKTDEDKQLEQTAFYVLLDIGHRAETGQERGFNHIRWRQTVETNGFYDK